MSSSVDVASLAGTWVGAGVGLIALFALVGPLLIWLASRTDRQRTINSLGRDNNDYVSSGWHLGPNIYLWHRVRAPLLKTAISNASAEGNLSLDSSCLRQFETQATWIPFGALLSSYGIQFARGDSLVIRKQKAFLPIHPSWVYAIGLLGRYSSRRDQGHLSFQKRARFSMSLSRQPIPRPGTPLTRGHTNGYGHELDERSAFERPALYGTTGIIRAHDRKDFDVESLTISFEPGPPEFLKSIEPEVLALRELFLLSMGLLPLGDKRYASLMNVSEYGPAYFERPPSVSEAPDRLNFIYLRESRDSYPVRRDNELSEDNQDLEGPDYIEEHMARSDEFTIYRLNPIDADVDVSNFGQAFFNVMALEYWGFTATRDAASEKSVRQIKGNSYVPAESEWVRASLHNTNTDDLYMPRSDAQQLALALLTLEWHPESYLIGCQMRGPGMMLLTGPSHRLVGLMGRVLDKYRNLSLSQEDQQKLFASLHPAFRNLDKSGRATRQAFRLMYQLDKVLGQLGSRPDRRIVDRIIGILSLTNYEFLELVYQSMRNLRVSTTATIQLDLRSTTLKVPSVFGVTQDFPVDMDIISPNEERSHETIDISHTVIVLATMRGVLRSKMLDSCLDARPLLEMVGNQNELILIH